MSRRRSINSLSPRRSMPGTRDTSFADKTDKYNNMKPVEEEVSNGVLTGTNDMTDKDKEITRLRLQNAQLKVLVERRYELMITP